MTKRRELKAYRKAVPMATTEGEAVVVAGGIVGGGDGEARRRRRAQEMAAP